MFPWTLGRGEGGREERQRPHFLKTITSLSTDTGFPEILLPPPGIFPRLLGILK